MWEGFKKSRIHWSGIGGRARGCGNFLTSTRENCDGSSPSTLIRRGSGVSLTATTHQGKKKWVSSCIAFDLDTQIEGSTLVCVHEIGRGTRLRSPRLLATRGALG